MTHAYTYYYRMGIPTSLLFNQCAEPRYFIRTLVLLPPSHPPTTAYMLNNPPNPHSAYCLLADRFPYPLP